MRNLQGKNVKPFIIKLVCKTKNVAEDTYIVVIILLMLQQYYFRRGKTSTIEEESPKFFIWSPQQIKVATPEVDEVWISMKISFRWFWRQKKVRLLTSSMWKNHNVINSLKHKYRFIEIQNRVYTTVGYILYSKYRTYIA